MGIVRENIEDIRKIDNIEANGVHIDGSGLPNEISNIDVATPTTDFKIANKKYVDESIDSPSITGTATFTNLTNNINLTGLGGLDNLEVGDVITISGSTSNDGEYTVEVITDADNIIVNQAHAGGTTTKSLTDETSTANVTIKILAKWYNAPIGLGQGWVDVIASRSAGVTYTNSTGKPIVVIITTNTGDLTTYTISGVAFTTAILGGGSPSVTIIVPNNGTYSTSKIPFKWLELR